MRWLGKIEPGSASGGSGQVFIWCRPNATVDAKATESCFLRLGMRRGRSVSLSIDAARTDAGSGTFSAVSPVGFCWTDTFDCASDGLPHDAVITPRTIAATESNVVPGAGLCAAVIRMTRSNG